MLRFALSRAAALIGAQGRSDLRALRSITVALTTLAFVAAAVPAAAADAESTPLASLTSPSSQPFGVFDGVSFVRHSGVFEGETSLGPFRVPYEIVAPADPSLGNGTVLFEPPHNLQGPLGRDFVLTRELLFGSGFAYAAVGFGTIGLNILDPSVPGLMIAGASLPSGVPIVDEEIIVQFVHALSTDPVALAILGEVERRYAYGVSQTGAALLETFHSAGGPGLFDLTLLHIPLWRPGFLPPGVFDGLPEDFQPLAGVGRVLFVEAEGDLFASRAEEFRRAAGDPSYRVYEVAGAPHVPLPFAPFNPLDHAPIARAAFVAGDAWTRDGTTPPPSTLLEVDASGEIARDGDGNALGGVRLPDLAVGRGQYIASIPGDPLGIGLPGIVGLMIDLACEPAPGSTSDEPRFRNHGDYVGAFSRATNDLRRARFLLDADAEALKEQAAASDIGKPGTCVD